MQLDLKTRPVALNPRDPAQNTLGSFRYAGGLELLSSPLSPVHELSDLELKAERRLFAVSDAGLFFETTLVLNSQGQLTGLKESQICPLTREDGQPLQTKEASDAEGLAFLAGGEKLVSFEKQDRILLYPGKGHNPRQAPTPRFHFEHNLGMEALSADPLRGPDAYLVGAEADAQLWTCRLSEPECQALEKLEKPAGYQLVALKRLKANLLAYLLRLYQPETGKVSVLLKVKQGPQVLAEMELTQPLNVDNFEGLAAVPDAQQGYRFYLISDDNGSEAQRTLLMAFDWKGPSKTSAD